ncbi:MAG: glycosyltransferase family 4 protein [Planctomycetota bacterium]
MMRVAYVSSDPGVSVLGTKGCSIHVQSVIREFLRRGFEVDLYARRLGDVQSIDLKGIRVFKLERPEKTMDGATREQALKLLDRQTRILLEKNGPYDLVYERHSLWSSSAMQYAADHDVRSVLEVNAPLIAEQQQHRGLHDEITARQMTATAFKLAGGTVCVSRAVADYVWQSQPNANNVRVIPNGVNVARFDSALERIQQRWKCRAMGEQIPLQLGFVGTLRPWHGMKELGEAFRRLLAVMPQAHLLVVGDGPAKAELVSAVGEDLAQAITITGKVAHRDVPRLMSTMDIALAPYPDTDNFYFSPLKVLEYMAAGLPIVASRCGDLPTIIEERSTGLLVKPGCPDSICAAVTQLAAQPDFARNLGRRSAIAAKRSYTWQHVVDATLDLVGIGCDIRRMSRSVGGLR